MVPTGLKVLFSTDLVNMEVLAALQGSPNWPTFGGEIGFPTKMEHFSHAGSTSIYTSQVNYLDGPPRTTSECTVIYWESN